MKQNLREKLYDLIENESQKNVNYVIAKEIIFQLNSGKKLNSVELARSTFSSRPTITRFAKNLGYNGFKEFSRSLELENINYFQEIETKDFDVSFDDYHLLLQERINELNTNKTALIEIARIIAKNNKVFIFSNRHLMQLTENFVRKLRFLGIQVYSSPLVQSCALNIVKEGDLILFLKTSIEEQLELAKIWEQLSKNNKKILITSSYNNKSLLNPDYLIKIKSNCAPLKLQMEEFSFHYLLDQLFNLIVFSQTKFLKVIKQAKYL